MPQNISQIRGRQAEELTADALRSDGMLLLVTGVTGTGKTTFLRRLGEHIDRENVGPVHYVSADEFECEIPFSFIERILSAGLTRNAQIDPTTPSAEVATRLLHALVDLPDGALRTVLIDNAHWIDSASVRVLRYIIPRVVQQRVILAFATRYRDHPESFAAHLSRVTDANPQHRRFDFEPLTVSHIKGLAIERLGTGISTAAAEKILGATGGTFSGVERVFSQLTPDEIRQLHLTWDVPIREWVPMDEDPTLRPYTELDAAGRLATEIVALASQELSAAEVRAVARCVGGEVDIPAATSSALIVESGFGATLAPAHPLISCSLRQRLSTDRAQLISRALAGVTDGFVAVLHALDGASGWDAGLAETVNEYVADAIRRGRFDHADEALRGALGLASGAERERLLLDLVLLNLRNKTGFAVLEFLPEIETLPASLLRECVAIALGMYRFDDEPELERLDRTLSGSNADDDADTRTLRAFLASIAVIISARSRAAHELTPLLERAHRLWEQAPEEPADLTDARLAWMIAPRAYTLILESHHAARTLERQHPAIARAELMDLIARARALPLGAHRADALAPLAQLAMSLGDLDLARELSAEAIASSEHGEPPWAAGTIRVIHAHSLMLSGHLQEARSSLSDAEEVIYGSLEVGVRLTSSALRASIAAITGSEDPQQLLVVASRLPDLPWEGYGSDLAIMAECEAARSSGDPRAVITATEPERVQHLTKTQHGYLTYRAHALIDVGRLPEAEELVAALSDLRGTRWFEFWGSLEWLQARITEARGASHAESAETPEHHYRAALDGENTPLVEALTRADYAAHLVSRGRAGDAQAHMHRAREIVSRIGAHAYLPRLTDQATDIGDPAGTVHLDLLATLTPREDEIARYLADGRSTKFISEALFVSPATVRFHVANVLRKLHVSSRNEVSRVLRGPLRTP